MSRGKKVVFALFVMLAALLFLEAALRVLGLASPQQPFTEIEKDGSVTVTYNFNNLKFSFVHPKPAGTRRILVLGGSSALGFPYHGYSSFGDLTGAMLERVFPGERFEVINLARMGMSSGEALYVLKKAMVYEPDLIFVYSGHNDFLAANRKMGGLAGPNMDDSILGKVRVVRALNLVGKVVLGSAMMGATRILEDNPEVLTAPPPEPIDPQVYERVVEEFRLNMVEIGRRGRDAGVPVVISAVAANLSGWPPYPQSAPPGFGTAEIEAALRLIDEAHALAEAGRFEAASESLYKGEARQRGYPLAVFERGRMLLKALEQDRAKSVGSECHSCPELRREVSSEFELALSTEARLVVSDRAPLDIVEAARQAAAESDSWFLDCRALFERMSTPPGFNFFHDHCHPNLEGQDLIARELFGLLLRHNWPSPYNGPSPAFDKDAWLRSRGLDNAALQDILTRMGVYLGLRKYLPDHSAATRHTLELASASDPDNPLPPLLLALVLVAHDDLEEAKNILLPLTDKPGFEKTMRRYMNKNVDYRDGVFLVRRLEMEGAVRQPPLRGLLKTGMFEKEKTAERDRLPLDMFNIALDLKGAATPP